MSPCFLKSCKSPDHDGYPFNVFCVCVQMSILDYALNFDLKRVKCRSRDHLETLFVFRAIQIRLAAANSPRAARHGSLEFVVAPLEEITDLCLPGGYELVFEHLDETSNVPKNCHASRAFGYPFYGAVFFCRIINDHFIKLEVDTMTECVQDALKTQVCVMMSRRKSPTRAA